MNYNDLFKNFDSILAALKPSEYREYCKLWRGKNNKTDYANRLKDNLWNDHMRSNLKHLITVPSYKDVFKSIVDRKMAKNRDDFIFNTL